MKKLFLMTAVLGVMSTSAFAGQPIYNDGNYIGCTVDGTNFSANTSAYAGGSLATASLCEAATVANPGAGLNPVNAAKNPKMQKGFNAVKRSSR